MSPASVLPVIFTLAAALLTVFLLTGIFRKQALPVRFMPVDGLRGYLAFFVFIHHAGIYYHYLHSGVWTNPASRLYNGFGAGSVCLFFMITAFLFSVKLIESPRKPIDWRQLFVSRLLRLYPLYLVMLAIVLLLVACLSRFRLSEPPARIAGEIGHWLLFCVFQTPDINAGPTAALIARVQWSLKYEWLFYLSLPAAGLLFFRSRSPWPLFVFTTALALILLVYTPVDPLLLASFSGGIAAAFLVRSGSFCRLASTKLASLLIITSALSALAFFPTLQAPLPLTLLSVAFIGIAGGNSLFGLLTHAMSRELGQLSYGIYLMHGLFLYTCVEILAGEKKAASYPALHYWAFISCVGAAVVAACFFLHYRVELPAMKRTRQLTAFLRHRLRFAEKR